ncbi:DVU_1551 family NTP transferase [Syntrophotalea carbinolica]|nr:NTP transferase domain-containing protein [Syntrophotalea carbinolica]
MTEPLAAVILSAGFSSRMGDFKPLLRLGEETALEKSVNLFRRAGIEHLQVILGHQAELLMPLVAKLGVAHTVNPRYREGMFTSVQCAMRQLPDSIGAFFLLPVDMPLVREQTLQTVRKAWQTSDKGIVHPVFWGRRGHPPLISTSYRQMILDSRREGGLKALLLPFGEDSMEIEVPDEHCILDMDRPQDYAYLRHRWDRYAMPSYRECEHLLAHHFAVSAPVAEHCRMVARVALTLAVRLNRAGLPMDREQLQAAGLLHDCCRQYPDHAIVAARALQELGFPKIAELVATHMEIVPSASSDPSPHEVLYLADKLVAGPHLVSLDDRFAAKRIRFADQASALAAVERRQGIAQRILEKCENRLRQSLADVLAPDALEALKG